MALIKKRSPITGTAGAFSNIFPSQKPINFLTTRLDQEIKTITSGTDGVVKIKTASVILDINIGDFVAWGSDAYSVRSSKVLNVVSSTELEVDEIFVSSNAANSFINYRKSWFLEIRYVEKSTVFDAQDAIRIFDFNSQVPNSLDGSVIANIGLPAEKLVPDFVLESGINEGLFTEYKIQYRQSWANNRSRPWRSSEPDVPIMLVHGTDNIPNNDYTDLEGTKRFIAGYPLLYTFIYSDVNDLENNNVKLFATQHDIQQEIISSVQILEVTNANGVYTLLVDPDTIDSSCVYVRFTKIISSSAGQYSGDDYDPDDYQVLGDGVGDGFPFTFPFILT